MTSPTREDQTASKETPRTPPPPTTPSSLGLDISGLFSENFGAHQPESLSSIIPSQDELQRVLDLVKQYLPAQVSTILATSDSDSQDAEVNVHVDSQPSHLPEAITTNVKQKPPPASSRTLSGLSTAASDGFLSSTPGRSGSYSTAGTPDIEKATVILAFPSAIERRFTDLYASDRATDGHGTSSERATSSSGRAATAATTTTSGGHTNSTSAGHTTSTNGLSHHADDGHSPPSDGPIAQNDGHSGRIPLYDVHRPAKKGTASTWLSSRERVDSPLASSLYADAGHSTLSGDDVPSGAWKPAFGPRTSSMMGMLSRSTSEDIDSPAQGSSIEGHVGHSSAGPSTPAVHSLDAQSSIPMSIAQSSLPMSTAADAGHSSYGFDASLLEHGHDVHAHDSLRDDASRGTLAGSAAGHAQGDTQALSDGLLHNTDDKDHTPPTVNHHHECPVKQRLEARHHREDGLGTHPKELSAMQQDEDAEEHARVKHAREPTAQKDSSPTARVRFSDRLRGEAKVLTGKLVRKEGRVEEGRRIMGRA
ncbi:uncharacterized protein SCHCODRAFT_02630939 [Schizophyllum commune H4-8]|nr:uncharacterized protein SCHCODRAFT_02630939 [Schizophyllum commune H4-8]KAI5890131.1 hypothetical protein SCHCODRAFT_02630939 [Schizophyllum commune H4-8]